MGGVVCSPRAPLLFLTLSRAHTSLPIPTLSRTHAQTHLIKNCLLTFLTLLRTHVLTPHFSYPISQKKKFPRCYLKDSNGGLFVWVQLTGYLPDFHDLLFGYKE